MENGTEEFPARQLRFSKQYSGVLPQGTREMPSVHHFYGRNAGFHEAENSTVHGHVIVLLDGSTSI
jgi:hypothetical protein